MNNSKTKCDPVNQDIAQTLRTISRLIESGQLHFSSRDEVSLSLKRKGPSKDFIRAFCSMKTFLKGLRSSGYTSFSNKSSRGELATLETANMAVYFTREEM